MLVKRRREIVIVNERGVCLSMQGSLLHTERNPTVTVLLTVATMPSQGHPSVEDEDSISGGVREVVGRWNAGKGLAQEAKTPLEAPNPNGGRKR
jgi:hypothetical protein